MADQRGLGDTQFFHEIMEQLHLVFESVMGGILAAISETPQVERVSAVLDAQLLHRRNPIAPGTKPAMNEDYGATTAQDFIVNQVVFNGNGAHSASHNRGVVARAE